LRTLEDERDQIVSVLSGTPGGAANVPGDRTALRARLDEINKEIRLIADERSLTLDDGETEGT
jgi:hypothetical protein